MTLAVYDYLGYYNICHLGDEVRDPARTIPRAVNRSIWIVAILYLTMNLSILGVIPWQEAMQSEQDRRRRHGTRLRPADRGGLHVARRVGRRGVHVFDHAGIFAHSVCRGPAGGFLLGLRRLHPRGQYPVVSLLTLGGLTAICCYFPLQQVIDAAVAVRILIQFIGQTIGAAPVAENAARRSASLSHAALPAAEPGGPRRLAVSPGHVRLEGLGNGASASRPRACRYFFDLAPGLNARLAMRAAG